MSRGRGRLMALGGAAALVIASACSSEDSPCASQACSSSELAGQGGAIEAVDTGDAGASGSAGRGEGGLGMGGHRDAAFAGESSLGGRFAEEGGAAHAASCRRLYLPLLVARDFRATASYPCPDRAPLAAGDCAALAWMARSVTKVTWEPIGIDELCLEPGAALVRFQARSPTGAPAVNFSVAAGFETGPVALTDAWSTYEIDVAALPYDRFDSFGSLPPGITALTVAPVAASESYFEVYIDDLRWVRASGPVP